MEFETESLVEYRLPIVEVRPMSSKAIDNITAATDRNMTARMPTPNILNTPFHQRFFMNSNIRARGYGKFSKKTDSGYFILLIGQCTKKGFDEVSFSIVMKNSTFILQKLFHLRDIAI